MKKFNALIIATLLASSQLLAAGQGSSGGSNIAQIQDIMQAISPVIVGSFDHTVVVQGENVYRSNVPFVNDGEVLTGTPALKALIQAQENQEIELTKDDENQE